MIRSLHNRDNRQFGNNIQNTLNQDNLIDSKLNLKPRPHKSKLTNEKPTKTQPLLLSPQMNYSDQILKYALTKITYPHILKGPSRVKQDVESLLFQVTTINGQNCLWHEDFMSLQKSEKQPFYNKSITLQKRAILINWLITIHKKYTLRQQTLHLTIKLIDDYCINNDVPLKRYQLIGVTAFFMAAKFQQIQLPKFKDYFRLLTDQFTQQQMRLAESEILCKSHFLLSKKITVLWYMEAFGLQKMLFGGNISSSRQKENKENSCNLSFLLKGQQPEITKIPLSPINRFNKFMQHCNYVLNLILIDYKITIKHRQDIVAISILVFTTYQNQYADADGVNLLKHFTTTKQRLTQRSQTVSQIKQQIKKCVKKIQLLYKKRFQQKFQEVNKKFNYIQ